MNPWLIHCHQIPEVSRVIDTSVVSVGVLGHISRDPKCLGRWIFPQSSDSVNRWLMLVAVLTLVYGRYNMI